MRQEVQSLVAERDLEALCALAARERRVLSALLPLTYEPAGLRRWRAVEALGVAAAVVADRDPEFVRGILRRLLWSLSDESGGIGWSAPEAIGAIVARRLELFAAFAPLVVALFANLEEDYFCPGILWAVGLIAERQAPLVQDARPHALALLDDRAPQTRGMAAWCLARLKEPQAAPALKALLGDEAPVAVYENGQLRATTVADLAAAALAALSDPAGD